MKVKTLFNHELYIGDWILMHDGAGTPHLKLVTKDNVEDLIYFEMPKGNGTRAITEIRNSNGEVYRKINGELTRVY